MIIIDNAITDTEIDSVRSFVTNHPKAQYINWIENDKIIDNRWVMNLEHPSLSFIKTLVGNYFHDWAAFWSAYQIQSNPHNIHIDEWGTVTLGKDSWPDTQCWTYILSFDTIPEFKTIVWKEEFLDGQSFAHWIEHSWVNDRTNMTKHFSSQDHDLEHTYDHNNKDYVSDYLTLEGIFTYKKGSAVLFDGNKLHCTNNWLKYQQHTQRELLQIHVLSNSPKFDF